MGKFTQLSGMRGGWRWYPSAGMIGASKWRMEAGLARDKIFLSASSGQFKACREALRSDLYATGAEVVVQEDFTQHPGALLQKLEDLVAGCDRVIALVGTHYGAGPEADVAPAGAQPRSYTQWEYHFARGERLDGSRADPKDLFVYFASPHYLAKHPTDQSDAEAQRQRAFIDEIVASNKDRNTFDSIDQLARLVLRDGFRMQNPERWVLQNLPFTSIGNLFKGRAGALETLAERLDGANGQATAITARQAIHGLGGIGKTRLAIEYAWQHIGDYPTCLFVGADSPQALEANLARLCGERVLDLPEKDAQEQEVQTTAALRWFTQHDDWLLILDNVDTPGTVQAVTQLLPQLHRGRVLITSRLSDWGDSVQSLPLDTLDEADAIAYLLDKTEGGRVPEPNDGDTARMLASTLGGLALALEQAGAFIARKRISLSGYLRRWQASEAKLREWHDPKQTSYPNSLAVTWETSFEQLSPAGQALLNVLSYFAPDPIPRNYLAEGFDTGGLAAVLVGQPGPDAADATPDLEDLLDELAGLSLLKWEQDNRSFTVHRLLQEMACNHLGVVEQGTALDCAIRIIEHALPIEPPPDDVRSWPHWEALRPHVEHVIAHSSALDTTRDIARMYADLAVNLFAKALYREAEPLMRRALAIDEQAFGDNHPKVAGHLINLASLLQDTNRVEEAEPLVRRALAIVESSHGDMHPFFATALNNLAQLLKATNRGSEAEPLMRRVLEINEGSYGQQHPEVAAALNNLAQLLLDTNRWQEAEVLMRRALAVDEAIFGSEHPNVARDLNGLAHLLKATKRLDEAEPLLRRALLIVEASYGGDHSKVAIVLNNLAQLLIATNRFEPAEPLLRRALTIDESNYGDEHPDVAIRLNNLALLYYKTGRLEAAEPLSRRHVKSFVLFTLRTGHEHPHLNAAIANYAALLKATDLDEAAIRSRIQGLIEEAKHEADR